MAKGGKSGDGKVSSGLVAASFAAVLAVYTAGYSKTQEAALRLDAQHQERRPARVQQAEAPATEQVVEQAAAQPAAEAPAQPVVEQAPLIATKQASAEPAEKSAPAVAETQAPKIVEVTKVAPAPKAEPVVTATMTPQAPAANVAVTPAAPANSTPAAAAPAVVASAPKIPVTTAPAAAPTSAEPAPKAEPPKPKWYDGEYWGWGTSRHGDIEAHLVIKDGRIVTSEISTCETRYPCDVIAAIIKQPVKIQSPDVDYVSRATESADAYYYALVEALRVASKPPKTGQ